MTRAGALVLCLLAGTAVGAAATFFAVVLAGGGHGTYYAAKALFPYSMGLTAFTTSITPPLIVLGLIQFPVYGLAVWLLGKERWWIVPVTHLAAIPMGFVLASPSFTP